MNKPVLGKRVAFTVAALAAILLLQLGLIFVLAAISVVVIPVELTAVPLLIGLAVRRWLYRPGERDWGRWTIGLLVFGNFALAVLLWRASARFSERRELDAQVRQ